MKINWKLRFMSVKFWLALIPAVLLVIQTIAACFGYKWDFVVLNQQIAAVVNAVFAVLTILGVTIDPTTPGIGDSSLVLSRSAQVLVPKSAVQVPNPNPQGQPIAETPQIQPINTDDDTSVLHETQTDKAGDANVVQH
ncbi:phage holin [Schleiferilactobacillus harbinensis]|uniref:phage holin n=1 Tax=Schleiferilactobacillus harbinensis TaxID=304207 RepID=UPI0039E8D808